jgi:hypothetical protein
MVAPGPACFPAAADGGIPSAIPKTLTLPNGPQVRLRSLKGCKPKAQGNALVVTHNLIEGDGLQSCRVLGHGFSRG